MRLAQKNLNVANKLQAGKAVSDTVVAVSGMMMMAGNAAGTAGAGAEGVAAGAGGAGAGAEGVAAGAKAEEAASSTGSTGFFSSLGQWAKKNPVDAYNISSSLGSTLGQAITYFTTDSDEGLDLQYPYVYDL
jgi:hypothetical protein